MYKQYSNFFLATLYSCIDMNAFHTMMALQSNVPVFLIIDSIPFGSWLQYFDENALNVDKFTNLIDNYNLHGLFFDNLYSVSFSVLHYSI